MYVLICHKKVEDITIIIALLFSWLLLDTISDFSLWIASMWICMIAGLVLNIDNRDFGGRTKNLPAGWVANNSVASPLCKGDFWLLSHAGLLGSKIIIISLILIFTFIGYSKSPKSLCANAQWLCIHAAKRDRGIILLSLLSPPRSLLQCFHPHPNLLWVNLYEILGYVLIIAF